MPTPVSSFEMGPGGNPDETRCMKAYSRSAADQEEVLPHELRPARVLLQCCWFLCDQICTQDQVRVLFWFGSKNHVDKLFNYYNTFNKMFLFINNFNFLLIFDIIKFSLKTFICKIGHKSRSQ